MNYRIDLLKSKLLRLKELDKSFKTFGSKSHRYKSTKINKSEIDKFEKEHSINLPLNFKCFLSEIGFGAGPDYGIFPFAKMISEFEEWTECLNTNSKLELTCDLTEYDANELIELKKKSPNEFHYKRLTNVNGILLLMRKSLTVINHIVIRNID